MKSSIIMIFISFQSTPEIMTLKTLKKTPVRKVLSLTRYVRSPKSRRRGEGITPTAASHTEKLGSNGGLFDSKHANSSHDTHRKSKTATKPPLYKGSSKELENLLNDSLTV